jgi:hypothetical protein
LSILSEGDHQFSSARPSIRWKYNHSQPHFRYIVSALELI